MTASAWERKSVGEGRGLVGLVIPKRCSSIHVIILVMSGTILGRVKISAIGGQSCMIMLLNISRANVYHLMNAFVVSVT